MMMMRDSQSQVRRFGGSSRRFVRFLSVVSALTSPLAPFGPRKAPGDQDKLVADIQKLGGRSTGRQGRASR